MNEWKKEIYGWINRWNNSNINKQIWCLSDELNKPNKFNIKKWIDRGRTITKRWMIKTWIDGGMDGWMVELMNEKETSKKQSNLNEKKERKRKKEIAGCMD